MLNYIKKTPLILFCIFMEFGFIVNINQAKAQVHLCLDGYIQAIEFAGDEQYSYTLIVTENEDGTGTSYPIGPGASAFYLEDPLGNAVYSALLSAYALRSRVEFFMNANSPCSDEIYTGFLAIKISND